MDFDNAQWRSWARLMEQVQKGDSEAYGRLLSEMSPLVFNYVRKRVFNPSHVEDIFQDVLLTFHKAKHTYQTDRPFSPWLFAIVRNAVWTSLHRNRRHAEREVPLDSTPEPAWNEPEEGGLDDRVTQALKSLPKDQRQAVEMLKLKGMKVEKAAQELGISKIALKVRAHRGYAQLRRILKAKGEKT